MNKFKVKLKLIQVAINPLLPIFNFSKKVVSYDA